MLSDRLLAGFEQEFQKLAQGDGIIARTKRRAQVASEFATPLIEAGLLGGAAKGLGLSGKKALIAAALGGGHSVYKKTRKFAG
jgi:hypothetical protein